MPNQYISFLITLNQAQTAALVKLLKHVDFTEIERVATDEKEIDLMRDSLDRVLKAVRHAKHRSH